MSNWQAEFAAWQQVARRVREMAERTERMMDSDARRTAGMAGLDPNMPYLHAHNAMCGLNSGKPWAEVDYSLARRVLWLEEKQFHVGRLAERVICRAYNQFSKPYNCAQYELR
jgi:hypothetical protein